MFWVLVIAYGVIIIKGSVFLYKDKCRNSDRAIVANVVGISAFFEIAQFCSVLNLSAIWSYFAVFNSVLYYAIIHGLEERQVGRGYCETRKSSY
jgi:hypothetical protein